MANQYFVEQAFTREKFMINGASQHHIFNVLRKQDGEKIELVFSDGEIALAEVCNAKEGQVKVVEKILRNNELPIQVTIAVGFPKADKLDFIVEKTTELGATEIWAAPFEWSVVKWDQKKREKKQEKLAKVALSAAEQSKRNIKPKVELFEKLSDWKSRFAEFDQIFVAYEEVAKKGEVTGLRDLLAKGAKKIIFIFGPEGGISPDEIAFFEASGAKTIALGPRIMRAETAPLYALSVLSAFIELDSP